MKTINKILAISGIGLASLLSGCDTEPTITMQTEEATSGAITSNTLKSRYIVRRVAVFRDSLAYEHKRGIYEITDTQTEKVYLGISGIGITEVGSHPCGAHPFGKVDMEDER